MVLIIGKIKCCFCKKKHGVMHSVHDYGIYGDVDKRIFYHPECLEIRQIYPTSFDHKSIDMAVFIVDQLKENHKETNSHIIDKYENNVRKLEVSHWDRMIPKRKKA